MNIHMITYNRVVMNSWISQPINNSYSDIRHSTFKSRCSSFNTAFYDGEGLLVLSRKRIAWRHIKTWFIIDVLTLGPEWFADLQLFGIG